MKLESCDGDKDIKERDTVKDVFPHATVLICLFQTRRNFRQEVSCEKMGITSGQRTLCLESVQKWHMLHHKKSMKNCMLLRECCPRKVLNILMKTGIRSGVSGFWV